MAIGMQTHKLEAQIKALKVGIQQFKKGTQNRITRRVIGKGMTVIRKGIRGKVPPKYKDIKRLVGARLAKRIGQTISVGKVGVGVGIKKARAKKINESLAKSRFKRKEKKGKKSSGVGIAPENVHWWILGTKGRQHKSGKSTGTMPPQVPDIVRDGFSSSYQSALRVIIEESRRLILIEGYRIRQKMKQALAEQNKQ